MKIKCTEIDWDDETEDGIKAPELPKEVVVELSDEEFTWAKKENDGTLEDLISNGLSESVGWLVNGYKFETVHG